MQDALAVYKGLSLFQKIAKKLTDTANVADVLVNGEGKRLREKLKKKLKECKCI